jgi:pimeloyl-ACP methyl ester carboxylesterase
MASTVSVRTVGDVQLEVRQQGSGAPLLFLHGEDGLRWSDPVLDELAADFAVTAPLHPAWGTSTRPRHIKAVRDLALVYLELLEEVSEPTLVVGCSFGAWLAAELAILRPPNVAGLLLVAPTGVKLGARDERDFVDLWAAGFTELPGILYGDPANAPDLTDLPDEAYLEITRAQEATARYCWTPYMHNPTLRHWLRRIAVPTTVVAGERDNFVLREQYFKEYGALIGADGADVHMVPGAGHRLEEERPDEVARLARELAQVVAGGRAAALTGGH